MENQEAVNGWGKTLEVEYLGGLLPLEEYVGSEVSPLPQRVLKASFMPTEKTSGQKPVFPLQQQALSCCLS